MLVRRTLRRIWPRLALVSCWGDGHAALALADLRRRLPGIEVQPKGLAATEAFVTLPFRGRRPLAVRSHLFEFMPEGASAEERPRLAHQLERGGRYEVVVTTGGGLYRYRLGDLVEVEGFVERTPSLRFLGKADQVADLRGEKLSEGFVAGALAAAFGEVGVAPRFALLAPEPASHPPRYVLYTDAAGPAPGLEPAVEAASLAEPLLPGRGGARPARAGAGDPGGRRGRRALPRALPRARPATRGRQAAGAVAGCGVEGGAGGEPSPP